MKMIPEIFAMLKSAKVEIKKEHQVLMVNKTTSFKKKGKGKKGVGILGTGVPRLACLRPMAWLGLVQPSFDTDNSRPSRGSLARRMTPRPPKGAASSD